MRCNDVGLNGTSSSLLTRQWLQERPLNMSRQNALLAKPAGDERIPERTLGYVSQYTKDAMFDFVTTAFIESGLSKSSLAKRLGKDPAQLTRILHQPGNWTIETCAELLFAINGSLFLIDEYWPMQMKECQDRSPVAWRQASNSAVMSNGTTVAMVSFSPSIKPSETIWGQGELHWPK